MQRPAALVDGGVDRRLVGEVDLDRLHARRRDLGAVHRDDFGAGGEQHVDRGCSHAGRPADDEHSLSLVAVCVEQSHVFLLSGTVRPGDCRVGDH